MATMVFASPEIRERLRVGVNQVLAVGVALAATALFASLATYNPHDPSLNTATSRAATNLLGATGATTADILLQYFGVAGALVPASLLAWAFRLASGARLRLASRLVFLLLALPLAAVSLAALPDLVRHSAAWPVTAGPGGAVGSLLSGWIAATAAGLAGASPVVAAAVPLGALLLALPLTLFALGLTAGEWRRAGRGAATVARTSVRGGREAAGLAVRTAGRVADHPQVAMMRNLLEPRTAAPASPFAPPHTPAYAPSPAPSYAASSAPHFERGPAPDPVRPQPAIPAAPEPGASPAALARAAQEKARNARPLIDTIESEAEAVRPQPAPLRPKAPPPAAAPAAPVENGWQFPPVDLLKPIPHREGTGPSPEQQQANARMLENVLGDYGVQGTIRDIHPGPVVTLYELEPAPGIRSARVIGLADDVARSMSVASVRIATVPGRNVIGIEVPNRKRETVLMKELIDDPSWRDHPGKLALAIGKDISGAPIVMDLARMPHLLIAGTTGSGKSVGINAMLLSLLYRLSPDQCRLILIDPKILELSVYEGIPHLLAPVVTEPAKAVTALKWATREMDRRYRAMNQLNVRNVQSYNERVADASRRGEVVTRKVQTGFDPDTNRPIHEEQALALKQMPFIVVVIDEMADLMMVAGKEVESAVQRLAQKARAAGIHVIMATQRPSVDVITGTIKANFPTRISFQVISKFDSRTILGEQGAEQLLGQGDLLHMQGGARIARAHGPFVSDEEVEKITDFLRAQAEPTYDDEVTEGVDEDEAAPAPGGKGGAAATEDMSLFDQAVDVVSREGKASTSFIQRHLGIGYNRAAKLIEQMEKEGIVSPANHVGKREVLCRVRKDDDDD